MSLFSKIGKAAKKVVKSVGKVAAVALPVAALGAALLPGVGGAVSTGLSKLGEKLKGSKALTAVERAATAAENAEKKGFLGIGDGKPGILGIGDNLPGVLGLFTGKGKAKKALEQRAENEALYRTEDAADEARLIASGHWSAGGKDKEEASPLLLLGLGLAALLVLKK